MCQTGREGGGERERERERESHSTSTIKIKTILFIFGGKKQGLSPVPCKMETIVMQAVITDLNHNYNSF